MSEVAPEQVLETYAAQRLARVNSARTFEFEAVQFTYKAAIPVEVLNTFLERDGSIDEITAICDATARACLENPTAWDEIRKPDHQPSVLDFASIVWLTDQIVTRSSGLPTERPADSSAGPPAATATTSTDGSGSTAATPTT
jgi:hypothetical protein